MDAIPSKRPPASFTFVRETKMQRTMMTSRISLEYENKTMVGTRFCPQSALRNPVLLVHGFGANRIGDGRLFVSLAQKLTEHGFEVFAFDRLGHGESEGSFVDITVQDEIDQLDAMLEYILHKANPKVHVLGHSLGGVEAAKLAARRPDTVASLTLWVPAAGFAHEISEKGQLQGKSIASAAETGYFDFEGQQLGLDFIEEAKTFEPYAGLNTFKNPVFVHQGEQDALLPVDYAERYVEIWEKQATLYTYPNADHGLKQLEAREKLLEQSVENLIQVEETVSAASLQ